MDIDDLEEDEEANKQQEEWYRKCIAISKKMGLCHLQFGDKQVR